MMHLHITVFLSEHNVEGSQNTRTEFNFYESEPEGFHKSVFNEYQLHMGITLTCVKNFFFFLKEIKKYETLNFSTVSRKVLALIIPSTDPLVLVPTIC